MCINMHAQIHTQARTLHSSIVSKTINPFATNLFFVYVSSLKFSMFYLPILPIKTYLPISLFQEPFHIH